MSADEVGVVAVGREELIVVPLFDDAATADDHDLGGMADGREAVGDDEGGTPFEEVVDGVLHKALGAGVNIGGRFIENEDAGVG